MPLIRFNALSGNWELKGALATEFAPISRAAAQAFMFEGVRQVPMWRGPDSPAAT